MSNTSKSSKDHPQPLKKDMKNTYTQEILKYTGNQYFTIHTYAQNLCTTPQL